MEERISKKVEEKDFIECKRCDMNSDTCGDRMLPCPRGSCEAMKTAKIIITSFIEIIPLDPTVPMAYTSL